MTEHEELAEWLEDLGDDYDDLYRQPSAIIRPQLARAAALLREARPQPTAEALQAAYVEWFKANQGIAPSATAARTAALFTMAVLLGEVDV